MSERSGTWYECTGLEYCEDDNTYTPYTYSRQALCSPVVLSCPLTCEYKVKVDLYTALFSSLEANCEDYGVGK